MHLEHSVKSIKVIWVARIERETSTNGSRCDQ
jgi:hypothetical protein